MSPAAHGAGRPPNGLRRDLWQFRAKRAAARRQVAIGLQVGKKPSDMSR